MSYKDIIVVDDVGDAFEALEKLCEDDLELNVIHAKSDENSLKKSFKRNSYLILINEEGLNIDLSLLIYFIKNNLYMLSIPIMIITGNEDSFKNQPVMEPPVINYIKRPIDNEDFKERLDISLEILEYYKNINDISGLPGSEIINSKLFGEISQRSKFAFVLLDLDNFKQFGEYYGWLRGNQVILFLADLLNETIKKYGTIDDFVGHVGGDDFVIILKDFKLVDVICNEIIEKFDEKIVEFYDEEDLNRGYIESENAFGEIEKAKIMGLSIISLNYVDFLNNSLDIVHKKMINIKKDAKMVEGSILLKG